MSINYLKKKAGIFGFSGLTLTKDEIEFFKKHRPLGFILFARNIDSPDQVSRLTSHLREIAEDDEAPILIDQEGGRVARLKPPYWRESPPAKIFFDLAKKDIDKAKHAVYLNSRLIANELASLGINVDCAPVLDILYPDAHQIVGDRAFGSNPEMVSELAAQMCLGLKDSGVMPIVKHIPGHGRATLDSHEDLPVVTVDRATLAATDFKPFRALNDIPWAMTAHIKYTALDESAPATLSRKVISVIRNQIGFDGVLLTDDLSMKALKGKFSDLTVKSFAAGCDLALHCNGEMKEMREVIENCPMISAITAARLEKGLSYINSGNPGEFDAAGFENRLAKLLA